MKRRQFIKALAGGAVALHTGPKLAGADVGGDESGESGLPRPSAVQLAWQQAELGLVYHYDLHIFDGVRYNQHQNRQTHFKDPDIFSPTKLDTDQWIEAARACGARFAIITASHETGFRLWQSDANPYCLKAVSWGDGRRDIVREFVESCRRAGIKPGVYLGTRWNGQLGVLDFKVTQRSPLTQAQYNQLIEREVEEICSRYGDLFELWFDGGAHGRDAGGPDVLGVFEKYQAHCLFYHSHERADARWGGTETGTVGYPCWATIPFKSPSAQKLALSELKPILRHGDPEGKYWCPAMSDAPLRNHEWFWEPNDERKIYSLDALVNMYGESVGRNSTLILGATPDNRGLMPQADLVRLKEMGDAIRSRFGKPIARTGGAGEAVELALPKPAKIGYVVTQEDIRHGERVRRYVVEGLVPGNVWQELCRGSCIGHKRIERFEPIEVTGVRLKITAAVAQPIIRQLAVFG